MVLHHQRLYSWLFSMPSLSIFYASFKKYWIWKMEDHIWCVAMASFALEVLWWRTTATQQQWPPSALLLQGVFSSESEHFGCQNNRHITLPLREMKPNTVRIVFLTAAVTLVMQWVRALGPLSFMGLIIGGAGQEETFIHLKQQPKPSSLASLSFYGRPVFCTPLFGDGHKRILCDLGDVWHAPCTQSVSACLQEICIWLPQLWFLIVFFLIFFCLWAICRPHR